MRAYAVHLRLFMCACCVCLQPEKEYMRTGHSSVLDHVTEVVYLVKQIELTKKTQQALDSLDSGDKHSVQVSDVTSQYVTDVRQQALDSLDSGDKHSVQVSHAAAQYVTTDVI